jgi:hypothetical protein
VGWVGGDLLHVGMFAYNTSGIAHQLPSSTARSTTLREAVPRPSGRAGGEGRMYNSGKA